MKNLVSLFAVICIMIFTRTVQGDPDEYLHALRTIEKKRAEFCHAFTHSTVKQKDSIIATARAYIISQLVSEIFPAWYGTPWDFNGTTTIPGKGVIACGYFITTTLLQTGFQIPRFRWAQLSAENIIKKFTHPSRIKRMSNQPVYQVEEYLKRTGEGLYVIGLDCHVGFVYYGKGTIRFIHANYYEPSIGVMSQELDTWNPLRDSRYRVIGKLCDDSMMTCWIRGEKFNGYNF